MRLDGYWQTGDDGIPRPVIAAKVLSRTGVPTACTFLLDSGADHTVLTAELVRLLDLPAFTSPQQLGGVGGVVPTAQVFAHVQLMKQDGDWITVAVECFAFTADQVSDMPILGRDVLNLFAAIVDRPGDTVTLLHGRHRYAIQES